MAEPTSTPSPNASPAPPPSVEDITRVLTETAENHPFDETALGADYADWCGTGTYGVYCTWKPTWSARNIVEWAREQHTEHLIAEQAHAVAILLGHPLAPETDHSPNTTFSQRNPRDS